MALKFLCIWALAFVLVAAASRKTAKNDGRTQKRPSEAFKEDNENGDLRFLTGSGNSGISSALNQYITQQQNLLERLRPTNTGSGSNLGTGSGSLTSGTGTLSGLTGSGSSSANGVTPILISLGNSNNGNANNGNNGNTNNNAAAGASPIGDLLPQIVAQGVLGNRRRVSGGNRRRVSNRRGGNRRRRPGNKGGVYVVRPRS